MLQYITVHTDIGVHISFNLTLGFRQSEPINVKIGFNYLVDKELLWFWKFLEKYSDCNTFIEILTEHFVNDGNGNFKSRQIIEKVKWRSNIES